MVQSLCNGHLNEIIYINTIYKNPKMCYKPKPYHKNLKLSICVPYKNPQFMVTIYPSPIYKRKKYFIGITSCASFVVVVE